MKNILMIGTGGTIASEMTPSGLTPELNSTQLLSFVPRIGEMCHVDCVQLYSLDSTNIRPAHWLGVAKAVRENYARYDGFVISHGTDTMAETAALLGQAFNAGEPALAGKRMVLTGAIPVRMVLSASVCGSPKVPCIRSISVMARPTFSDGSSNRYS